MRPPTFGDEVEPRKLRKSASEAGRRMQIRELHTLLRERITALGLPLVTGDVTRVFLEVSTEAVAHGLWSLEFSFDEDDSRVASFEARFGGAEGRGYAVRLLLPKTLPKNTFDGSTASEYLHAMPKDRETLIARFVRALEELGAYRFIEPLELAGVETELM